MGDALDDIFQWDGPHDPEEQTVLPPRERDDTLLVTPTGYTLSGNTFLPKHPRGDMSTGWPIVAALGSFWSRHFEDRGQLLGLERANSQQFLQAYLDYLEAVACVSRFSCPIFHRRIWHALVIKESEIDTGRAAVLKYGDGAYYDGSYRYGVPVGNQFHTADLTDIKHIGVLLNRMLDPTLAWVNGSDFFVEDGSIYLRDDPFNDARLTVTSILDDRGNVTDREVVLWAFNSHEDWEYLYEHYGYVIRRKLASSESYANLINSLWNGFVGGLSARDLDWALAAIVGIPMVRETSEVVEGVLGYAYKTVVCTDQHCYIYPAQSQANVSIGQTVYAGQALVDTVSVFDLANYDDIVALLQAVRVDDTGQIVTRYTPGESSSSSGARQRVYSRQRSPSKIKPPVNEMPLLTALPINRALLGSGYYGSLGFRNQLGSIDTATVDSGGRVHAKVVPLDGADEDVALFWSTAHANGVTAGRTWLEQLGITPAYVNPAGWVIEHFLRNNTLVVYLRYTRFGKDALGLELLELLRSTLLPGKAIIFLVEAEAETTDSVHTDVTACGDNTSSSSSSFASGCAVAVADALATEDVIDPATELYGYLGDLEPTVFYPAVNCD
jgi:hypothetical protein